jgi:D-alanyl-D-alanine carboxypeptidase/D-alanyl-D-alanine-endopeptidase (penicillin-binding protein 4)
MRFRPIVVPLLCALAARSAAAQGQTPAQRVSALLDQPPFDHALWGVVIADPQDRVLVTRNADRLFVPASAAKLVVAATAAVLLGPDYRFRTTFHAAGEVRDSVLYGDLVVYGRGDPTLGERFYPGPGGPFAPWADSLRSRGIARIAGDIVGDASWFDDSIVHPDWENGDLAWGFTAPVTALGWNGNAVRFRVVPTDAGAPPLVALEPDVGAVVLVNRARTLPRDSARTLGLVRAPGSDSVFLVGGIPAGGRAVDDVIAVRDGARWTAEALRRALPGLGITVDGRARGVHDPLARAGARGGASLFEWRSPPLADVLRPILEQSDNWTAEVLLKTLGRELRGEGSWTAGLDVERRFLVDSLRVDSTLFTLADGSGLSHHNLIAPRALVQLLSAMRRHPRAEAFVSALAVGGRSGTLRGRFDGARLAGRVRAKTGSIGNVNTLAGYLERGERRRPWVFAVLLNNHTARNGVALRRIDAVVAAIER